MIPPSSRPRKHRRSIALAASGLLHIAFVLAVFATATGTAPRGATDPFGDGEAVEVMLAGHAGAPNRRAISPTTSSELDRLAQRLRTQPDALVSEPEPTEQRGDLTSIFTALGSIGASGSRGDGRTDQGDESRTGREARSAAAAAKGEATLDASSGELWGQIAPCWRRLGGRSTIAVTLEVKLDRQGGLAAPPKIVRPESTRPGEQRLLAEALALEAIRACLPYRSGALAPSGTVYRLAFQAAGRGP